MALDRQSIEKKDFPIGRRGYDPEAVDSHLASLAEEVEALSTAASLAPKASAKDSKPADPDLSLLQTLVQANMLEPYVLLSAPDQGIANDYPGYRETHRTQLEDYLSRFVTPPAPAKP